MQAKNKNRIWIAFVVVIVLISLIVVYVQGQQGTLSAPSNKKIENPTETISATEYDLKKYKNDEYGFTVSVPPDWKKVTKDGFDTYIHSPSATSCQVRIYPYKPSIINTRYEPTQMLLSLQGYNLSELNWFTPTKFTVIYTKGISDTKTTLYLEIVEFDKDNIVSVLYTIDSQNFEKMQSIITAMIDGFVWEKKNPFPEAYRLVYNESFNYEFAYPDSWNVGVTDNTYIAQDTDSGTYFSVVATKSNATFESFDKLDYTNYAAKSRQDFILQNYHADANMIYGEATYSVNNTSMKMVQYLIATGETEFSITAELPEAQYNAQAETLKQMFDNFRYFN